MPDIKTLNMVRAVALFSSGDLEEYQFREDLLDAGWDMLDAEEIMRHTKMYVGDGGSN